MSQIALSSSALVTIIIIFSLWLIALTLWLTRSEARFRSIFGEANKRDLRNVLEMLKKDNQTVAQDLDHIQKNLEALNLRLIPHVQKVGFIRYNPFSDTGGDQSFCLCLLDGQDNGVVISSLHSRDQTRIYAKRISRGKSPGYTLSKEERAVINKAIGH